MHLNAISLQCLTGFPLLPHSHPHRHWQSKVSKMTGSVKSLQQGDCKSAPSLRPEEPRRSISPCLWSGKFTEIMPWAIQGERTASPQMHSNTPSSDRCHRTERSPRPLCIHVFPQNLGGLSPLCVTFIPARSSFGIWPHHLSSPFCSLTLLSPRASLSELVNSGTVTSSPSSAFCVTFQPSRFLSFLSVQA